jgi:predicted nucleic acid-binding protein
MRVLVDTNILLRAIQHDSPFCGPARQALKLLHRQNHELCLTPQNVKEFWNACTRPTDHNGLGISVAGTERHTLRLERYFTILPDSALTYAAWRELVLKHQVIGSKVHDAYLVAAMKAHALSHILTFNTGDFKRYTDIRYLYPSALK